MTTKKESKNGQRRNEKRCLIFVIYAFNQEPTAERQERF